MRIDTTLTPAYLRKKIENLLEISGAKIRALEKSWDPSQGAPVFTSAGVYTTRSWTEWTMGFMFGSALLQYDATGERWFLDYGREQTITRMPPYVSHTGVHDHGFNVVSTYGNVLRLAIEEKFEAPPFEKRLYELALRVSGAVQASRWTRIHDGRGFIYSFHGPHSLFADTMRTLRCLAIAHRLGHVLMGEADQRISLLERLVDHASVTAKYAVFYGEGRDRYDVRGRVTHESIFSTSTGLYRCPNTQQGYSPFTTWTRGLAWVMCGFAEELEFLATVTDDESVPLRGREEVEGMMLRAAQATCDYYIEQSAADGIPYWDTGAPQLEKLGDYLTRPSEPCNDYEPVDSSAASIAAQALWRLGKWLKKQKADDAQGDRYCQAALSIANTLFDDPYVSRETTHQGLILHSVYHRPNGWDYIPPGRKIPCGESSMWGDYHARELALLLWREIRGEPPLEFFHIKR
jgi:hypothetical protein